MTLISKRALEVLLRIRKRKEIGLKFSKFEQDKCKLLEKMIGTKQAKNKE